MDTAPPAVHTLLEIRKYCPEVFDKIEVWVDGGIKRGTDAVKALALGAKGVGVGRAALFGLGASGKEGVARVLESKSSCSITCTNRALISGPVLKAETETAMRLLGVEKIEQLGLQHVSDFDTDTDNILGMLTVGFQVNTRALERDIYDGPANLDRPSLWENVRSKL